MRTFYELDLDISRLAAEAGNLRETMRSFSSQPSELVLLEEKQKQLSGALDACYVELNILDILRCEQELKDFLQKQEQQNRELRQKEEFQKAEAVEKERQLKEFLDRQEREKQEFLQKQEREKLELLQKQEREKQEFQQAENLQRQESVAAEAKSKEAWEQIQKSQAIEAEKAQNVAMGSPAVQADAPNQENPVSDIAKETLYAMEQAMEAAREALRDLADLARREHENEKLLQEHLQELAELRNSAEFLLASENEQERQLQEVYKRQEQEKLDLQKMQEERYQEMLAKEAQIKAELAEKERLAQEAAAAKARPQENLLSEIVKDTLYSVGQAGAAVLEAFQETQRVQQEGELKLAFEMQKRRVLDYMETESFQGIPATFKEAQLLDRLREQDREMADKIAELDAAKGIVEQLKEDQQAFRESCMEAVRREQELELQTQAKLDQLRADAEVAAERLKNSGREQAAIEENLRRLEEKAAELQRQIQEEAERERQRIYEELLRQQLLEAMRQMEAARSNDFGFH